MEKQTTKEDARRIALWLLSECAELQSDNEDGGHDDFIARKADELLSSLMMENGITRDELETASGNEEPDPYEAPEAPEKTFLDELTKEERKEFDWMDWLHGKAEELDSKRTRKRTRKGVLVARFLRAAENAALRQFMARKFNYNCPGL